MTHRLEPKFYDVEWFVSRLTIIDRGGKRTMLGKVLYPEQRQFLKVFKASKKDILVLKPRQMGMTTIVIACLFWRIYTCPDPIGALSIMHELRACKRVNKMIREFIRGLPAPLKPRLNPDNTEEIGMSHNDAGLMHLMAGSRGEGRSFTYQLLHCSEMGQWPQGSAAKGNTSDGADEDTWASVNSTMHEGEYTRRFCEFTGDGVGGIGHGMVLTAKKSDDWEFMFFAWFEFEHYEIDVPKGWERNEKAYLEDAEADIIAAFYKIEVDDPLIDRKLAWRRKKLTSMKYSMRRFRREYPSKWDDPFMLAENAWFNGEILAKIQRQVPEHWKIELFEDDLRVYEEYDDGHEYFIGQDTSGGVLKDDATVVVVKDDYTVVAVWGSNEVPPYEQADMAAKLSARYGEALVLCEQNKYGLDVIERLEFLGVPTWKDHKGKNFWMQAGRAGETKREVLGFARELVNEQRCCSSDPDEPNLINDELLLEQLQSIREDEKGHIEAPTGEHDDYVIAYVLALWCGRWHYRTAETREDPETVRRLFIQRARQV